jgi:Na+-driven multidrug efflux pump
MIMQSALLGTKDSVTPLIVTLLCGGFNVIGDWFLVCYKNFGIRGAAIATAVSEVISMALLAKAVCKLIR